ncbi:TetR/AcrR family transcriptional regulator [Paenibacillus allorhizosphaerae]|uniref:HTH-type transcriptional regulator BetI n=1 Tax=Paenibacillus allorhizosphaerae TaxID=2849866 RepID=A0ABM8VUK4_9BACL|nr:TetR/AcrR family transcriptional regulator [Paenibacillus allorhizosphaerae]CAG7659009.1 HTH-type transcriptional regulator BetI [Paenibacillus allorhizosphaerae]
MPRTQQENERIRQATKENIRAAAMDIFIEQGYHDASIDDIAKRAGVSKGLLYNYYKGKEELLAEMVKNRIDEIGRVMQTASGPGSHCERLKHIIEGALDNVKLRPSVYRFFLHLQTQPEEDKVLSKYSQMLNEAMAGHFETQCEVFSELGASNARMRSLYFSTTLHGTMQMITIYQDNYPVEEMKRQIIRQFCMK